MTLASLSSPALLELALAITGSRAGHDDDEEEDTPAPHEEEEDTRAVPVALVAGVEVDTLAGWHSRTSMGEWLVCTHHRWKDCGKVQHELELALQHHSVQV